jgi:hypothetical protein
VDEEKAIKFLNALCPSWNLSILSSRGKLGGILVAWNPYLLDLQPFLCTGGILLAGVHIPDNIRISFINMYGLCTRHRTF